MQADEEMLLLEGIDSFGLGNWSAVSKNVGSKTAAECRDHYFEIFVRQGSALRIFLYTSSTGCEKSQAHCPLKAPCNIFTVILPERMLNQPCPWLQVI